LWPVLKCYPGIRLEIKRKTSENFSEDMWQPGNDSNRHLSNTSFEPYCCPMARGAYSFGNLGFNCQQLLHSSTSTYEGCSRPDRSSVGWGFISDPALCRSDSEERRVSFSLRDYLQKKWLMDTITGRRGRVVITREVFGSNLGPETGFRDRFFFVVYLTPSRQIPG
jgi:hypothetical protein